MQPNPSSKSPKRKRAWDRLQKSSGAIGAVLSVVAIYIGGLLSVAALIGPSAWSGLVLVGVGIAWFLSSGTQTDIEPSLEEKAEALATLQMKTYSELVNDAVREYLSKFHYDKISSSQS